MTITNLSNADYSALFKRVYGEYGDNLYGSGSEDVLESQIPKYFNFKGKDFASAQKVGFGGSVGFGRLPVANPSKNIEYVLTRKKAYARMNLDRETIVASEGKEGAFKQATSEETLSKLKSFTRVQALSAYNDGTGILGQFSGSAGGTTSAPTMTILNTGTYAFRRNFFEAGDVYEVKDAGGTWLTSKFKVTSINKSTRAMVLERISGTDDLTSIGAGTHSLALEGSSIGVPMGLLGIVNFSSGSMYGASFQERWQPYLQAKSGSPLVSIDFLNEAMLEQEDRAGEPFDLIIPSTKQMLKLLNQMEDKKRYTLTSTKNDFSKARVSFSGIEYMSTSGVVPIKSSRYVRDDMILFVTRNKMYRKHAEKFGWFDEDGTVLLRMPEDDAYEARYGGYYENFFNPFYVGAITGLSTT